jgi:hypothetical protein
LVVVVAWQLSGRLEVAALAGLVFVGYGSNWEPYLRPAAGVGAYISATALTLAGFSLYVRAHNQQLSAAQRRRAYIGFVIALILAPLAYELSITLIGACALYRLFVLERGAGLSRQELVARARDWLRDLGLPALLVLLWFGFKVWLGQETPAQGLTALRDIDAFVESVSLGLAQAFVPGVGPNIVASLWTAVGAVPVLLIELALIAVIVWRGTPAMRVVALWTMLMLATMVVGFGRAESRQLYMMTAPASILWASLLWALVSPTQRLLDRVRVRADVTRLLRFVPTTVVAAVLVLTGSRYAVAQQDSWKAAAVHNQELLTQIEQFARANPASTRLYLVDLPTTSHFPSGETVPMSSMNFVADEVAVRMPGRFEMVIPVVNRTSGRVPGSAQRFTEIAHEMLQPGALVLTYTGDETNGLLRASTVPDPAQLTKVDGRPSAAIVSIGSVFVKEIVKGGQVTLAISQDDLIPVTGQAAVVDGKRPGGFFVLIDDRLHFWAQANEDVQGGEPTTETGTTDQHVRFEATIPSEALTPGEHTLSLLVLTPDGRSYQQTKPVTIEVVATPAE